MRVQVHARAHFDGRDPSSYLLDPAVNFVPDLPLGGEDPLGQHALRFTGEGTGSGRRFELVALPDGGAFDVLGISGWLAAGIRNYAARKVALRGRPPARISFHAR